MTDYRKTRVPVEIKKGPHAGEDEWHRYSYRVRRAVMGGGWEYLTFYDPDSVVDRAVPSPRVPLRGACMHLWQSPDWRRELQLIADAGANVVRFDVNWKNPTVHYNQGKPVYVKDFMAEVTRLGMRAIVSFLSSDPITTAEFPAYAKAAATFCATYGSQYQAPLAALEVWNEPNGEGNMTPQQYAQLVKATYPAVKAVSQVPVIVGSLARVDLAARGWLTNAVAQGMPFADGLAVHPYSSKWPVATVGTALDVEGMKAVYALTGVPQWVTEFGCSTVSKTVDPNYSVTENSQDAMIRKAWIDVDTLPYVKAATLYNCVENGGDSIWGRWGVVHRDWTLKPGYAALKAGITR